MPLQRTGSRTIHRLAAKSATGSGPPPGASRRTVIPDGACTHDSGGNGPGTAVLVLIGAALAVKAAPAVLSAAAELLRALIIMTAVIVGVGAAGLVDLLTWQWRRTRLAAARAMPPLPSKLARAAQPLPQPRPAIERAPETHLRLHGITAEDVAAILRGRDGP